MTKTRSAMPTVVLPRAGRVAAVAVALVAALAPRPAAAQTSGDVGVTIAPAFLHYLDVDPVCCPASVWGAVGSGRWRAHVDYLRSTRGDATLHEVNVLAAWRFLERDDSRAALLFGPTTAAASVTRSGRRWIGRSGAAGSSCAWTPGLSCFASGSGPGLASESRRSAVGGTRPRARADWSRQALEFLLHGPEFGGLRDRRPPLAAALKPHPHHFGQSGAERP